MASFPALPIEILHHIICHLDPISLIALSQTSAWLRGIIHPIRHDFNRRLLALELLPEHGGIVPLFRGRDNQLTPSWDSDEWRSNKYACCGCMKLLPHMMFDNHAILRAPYRKPPPGSIEAQRAGMTDWEPLQPSIRWKHIQSRTDHDREEQRVRRAAVSDRYRELVAPAGQPFARVSHDRAVAAEEEAERYLCGASRHRRRCLECKYQRGDWSKPGAQLGNKEAPIVVSRQRDFFRGWERYFTSLLVPLPPDRGPRTWKVYGVVSTGSPWTLYAARCPCCSLWHELSAFRQWPDAAEYRSRPEPPTSPLLCNDCHLKTHKSLTLLTRELSAGLLNMLRADQANYFRTLGYGWSTINRYFIHLNRSSLNPGGGFSPPDGILELAKYKSAGEEILGGLKWANVLKDRIVYDVSNLPDLRRRLHRFRDFMNTELDEPTLAGVMDNNWFKFWVDDYELVEENYYWLQDVIDSVEGRPTLVLQHVQRRDPYMYHISGPASASRYSS